MNYIKKITLIMMSAVALSGTTLAIGAVAIPVGWYLEGNLGVSKISNVSYAPNTSISSTGLGWNLIGGYKFMPYFGAEVGYTSYASGTINFNGNKVGKDQAQAVDIAGKAIMPIQETGAEIFAKIGIARAKSDVTVSNAPLLAASGETLATGNHRSTDLYFGLGADYAFIPNAAINAQWNRVDGNNKTGNLDLMSIGISYMFD